MAANTFHSTLPARPFTSCMMHFFEASDLIVEFRLDALRLLNCFDRLGSLYHPDNPYHNCLHAADVAQAMFCFIQEKKLESIDPFERMVALIAASAHDVDHPGISESMLVQCSHHLVKLYNSLSVLENHHWRTTVAILRETQLFDHLDNATWKRAIDYIQDLILATDISQHKRYMTQFTNKLSRKELRLSESAEDRLFILKIALKCADISNPCRTYEVCKQWSERVCAEFFRQGDKEKEMGFPITPHFDRSKISVAAIQVGFITHAVTPLFDRWHALVGSDLSKQLLNLLASNKKSWTIILNSKQQNHESAEETEPERPLPTVYEITNGNNNSSLTRRLSTPGCTVPTESSLRRRGSYPHDVCYSPARFGRIKFRVPLCDSNGLVSNKLLVRQVYPVDNFEQIQLTSQRGLKDRGSEGDLTKMLFAYKTQQQKQMVLGRIRRLSLQENFAHT